MSKKACVILTIALMMAMPISAHSETFRISGESIADLKVFKAGVASTFAHDHVIRAGRLMGAFDYIPGNPPHLAGTARLSVQDLIVDLPEARKAHGLTHMLSPSDRKTVRENMLNAEQLDVSNYPLMEFRAKKLVQTPDKSSLSISGSLTIKGQTRALSFPVSVRRDGQTLVIEGRVKFKQSDFGITPYSAMLGAVRNQDGVELVIKLIGKTTATKMPK